MKIILIRWLEQFFNQLHHNLSGHYHQGAACFENMFKLQQFVTSIIGTRNCWTSTILKRTLQLMGKIWLAMEDISMISGFHFNNFKWFLLVQDKRSRAEIFFFFFTFSILLNFNAFFKKLFFCNILYVSSHRDIRYLSLIYNISLKS